MATTRTKSEETSQGPTAEAPGAIPEGVKASVNIKYDRIISPPENDTTLSDLALEADDDLTPPDPLAVFLEEWGHYTGYNCEVVRLPDPADRRTFTNQFAHPNFTEFLRLGGMPFDPITFVSSLQYINGNSGGVFRVWLTDQAGTMIPGARLDRVAVSDPPGLQKEQGHFQREQPAPPAPPAQREPSEAEKQLAAIQTKLLDSALDRLINPDKYTPPVTPPQGPQLSDEDQLGMMLLTRTDLLGNVVTKLTAAVNAADSKPASDTWRDKAMEFASNNPAVVTQVATAAERVIIGVTNLVSDLIGQSRGTGAPQQRPATQHAPAATPAAQASNLPPEAPDDTIDDAEEDDEIMAILDEMLALLNDTRPMEGTDPVFVKLRKEHPIKFPLYVRMIATANPEQIVEFVSGQSPLYQSLLTSPITGEHLKKRLLKLRTLCIAATTPAPAPEAPPAPAETEGQA